MAGPAGRVRSKSVRPKFNVFSLFDHMSGRYMKGKDGLWYLNGGMPHIMGYAGRGNTFKSALSCTFAVAMSLRYKFEYTEFYDTEISMQLSRIQDYINSVAQGNYWAAIPDLVTLMEDETNTWNFTAADEQSGDVWWKNSCRAEKEGRRKTSVGKLRKTVFKNLDGSPVAMVNPWSFVVDSFSELHTEPLETKNEKGSIGNSDMNMVNMDDSRHKAQLLGQMPNVAAQGNFYFGLVAHADDEIKMDQYAPDTKKLAGLKGNLKLKGVPGRAWSFLTNSCLLAIKVDNCLNKGDKMCEYPHPDRASTIGDVDLKIVTYSELRGKSGPTGAELDVVFSQREGMQFGLTEYHFIKEKCNGFGLISSGSGGAFKTLELFPEVTFTRKNIREHIRDNPKFGRALSITAAMAFMQYHWYDLESEYKITPAELREKLLAQSFDLDYILTSTVEYWYFEDQVKEINKPTITAMTLLDMALGKLAPKCIPLTKVN